MTLRIGLAVSTIGRPALGDLLADAAASSLPPAAVAIADQSGGTLRPDASVSPVRVLVLPSSGGISTGRNAAAAALGADVDVLGFPNDDSRYPIDLLAGVAAVFEGPRSPAVLACTYRVDGRPPLPVTGTALDRHSVWRAAEPALFVRREAFDAAGAFDPGLGVGSAGPWQSAEGTDLVLRIMAAGGLALSAADLFVDGPGERRDLSDDEFVAKVRRYARGTGRVYRQHDYPWRDLVRTLVGPWVGVGRRPLAATRLDLRLALARSLGRLEGIAGRAPRS